VAAGYGGNVKRLLSLLGILILGAADRMPAQSTFGALVGSLRDPSQASLGQTTVRVTNVDEQTVREVQSSSDGNYEVLNLKPGNYSILVSHAGFETSQVNDLHLLARQTMRVDVTLRVGSTGQTISVEGTAGVVASETDTIASSYGSEKILTLPVNFRASQSTSPYDLLTTLPGVQSDNNGHDYGKSYLSIQGGLPNQSESSIDGISSQNVRSNRPLVEIFPSVEGIAEMKVQGVGNPAEYGSAGDITTITKSGTNTFHGAGAWYYQNADFDSTPFGSTSKPAKEVNNFSFAGGGPVWIPKIYKGKDKTFFFADYEELRYPRTSTIQNYVPTSLERSGDFTREGANISDPLTGKAFPGNVIPTSRISPISVTILNQFFPLPNVGDLSVSRSANYIINKQSDIQSRQFDIRGDHYLTANQSIFARFSRKNATSLNPNNLLQPTTSSTQQDRSLVVSYNYNITPRVLNEFRLGYTQDAPGSNFAYDGKAFEKSLGFVGLPATPFNGLPNVSFNNLSGLDVGRVQGSDVYRTFQLNNNTTFNVGRHTMKVGFDIRFLRSQTSLGFIGADNFGNFNFTGTFTGNEFADFLLGIPSDTSYGDVQHDNDGRARQYHAYVQDNFRVSSRLTLEYGVRWDYQPPFTDKAGNIGNFDRSIAKTGAVIYPSNAQAAALLSPALEIAVNACPGTPNLPAPGPGLSGVQCTPFKTASQAGTSEGLRKDYKFNFVPRVGFAYRPFGNSDTVIRSGFGVYWAPVLGAAFYSLTGTSGTDVRTFSNISTSGGPLFSFPNTRTGNSGVSTDAYGTAYFGTANQIDFKNPKMYQWNFSIDRNIGHNTGLRVSYIGSHSIQLGYAVNLNQSAYSTTFYAQQPLTQRPYPYWFRIESRESGGTASYHSLQIELNRRFQNGLSFTGAYTLAKNLSDIGGPNPAEFGGETGDGRNMDALNRSENRGNVYGTRRNRFIGTAVYELPFGRGRTFMNHTNALTNAALGGWRLSSILLLQSGPYLTPYFSGGDPSGTGSGFYRNQRPDRLASGSVPNPSRDNFVDRSAFACPGQAAGSANQFNCHIGINPATDLAPIGRFGNSGIGIVEGPGTFNLSMALGKSFRITERVAAKIEGSFTNLPNHTNLADPILSLTNKSFGKITSARDAEFGRGRTGQVGVRIEF
jgi:hypothetical protein